MSNTEQRYPGLGQSASDVTKAKRKQIQLLQDDFCKFSWRGYDAFENFGAFIINNKNSLKIYNGSSFKNEYSQPQFNDGTRQLQGVTFTAQSISFTIGVYWISIQDYNIMLDWLHPYEIDDLTFDFNPNWRFLAKLSGMNVSTRYIVGRENSANTSVGNSYTSMSANDDTTDDGYRYYTELNLTFDIQGEQCALGVSAYDASSTLGSNKITTTFNHTSSDYQKSYLDTPLKLTWTLDLTSFSSTIPNLTTEIVFESSLLNTTTVTNSILLCNFTLKNLTTGTMYFEYDSESGLLFYHFNSGSSKILNLLSTATSGKRIVESMDIRSFKIPGTRSSVDTYNKLQDYVATGQIVFKCYNGDTSYISKISTSNINVLCYPRTKTL